MHCLRPFCFLLLVCASLATSAQAPTWSEDIAPLVYENCSHCHHQGQVAPFSLMSYEDAANNALSMYTAMFTGHMPPWPADPDYRHFVGETVVTDEEVAMLLEWLEEGLPYGDPLLEPEAPEFEDGGTLLHAIDFVAAIEPYTLQSDNEEYRWFVIPTDFEETKYIQAIEVFAGLPEAVHHADIHVDATGNSAALDALDPLPGFNGSTGWLSSTAYVNAWQPGAGPARFPDNWGIALPPGADLVIEIHYGPGFGEEIDQTYMNLEFVDDAANVRPVSVGWLLSSADITNGPLIIPPNEVSTFYQEDTPFWSDKSLIAICPHQHLLGDSYKVWMETPAGDSIPLIDIPEWQFHWQFYYTFLNPQKLPAGSTLKSEATYDNTASNPLNPNSPPVTVYDGALTTDEMLLTYFIYADYQEGDEYINLDPSLSVEESEAKLGWDVYPNPTTDQLRVDFPTGIPGADVVLTDAAGKIALEAHIQPGQPLDVQALPAGVYHVRLHAAHRMYTSTLIKN